MDEAIARSIAHERHRGQRTRHGSLMTEHVERVAAAVPENVRAVALLHDVLEKTDTRLDELSLLGLTETEREVLGLLTRRHGESFVRHTLRIGAADGPAGASAHTIKLADLDDHIAHARSATSDPP